jgi:branched-chain amino acid transport system ATP-binding protein
MHGPEAGLVRFDGEAITGLRPQRICQKGIARTFQISHSFTKMSVLENVLVAATFGNSPPLEDPRAWAEEMLAFVEFPASKDTLAGSLNTGQLRRLDLARALASKPRLLLLDEAAAGLTSSELTELQALIRKIREAGVTILIIEHLMQLIMQLCDRIAVLHYGEKIAEGTPSAIAHDAVVQEAYLGEKYTL